MRRVPSSFDLSSLCRALHVDLQVVGGPVVRLDVLHDGSGAVGAIFGEVGEAD